MATTRDAQTPESHAAYDAKWTAIARETAKKLRGHLTKTTVRPSPVSQPTPSSILYK